MPSRAASTTTPVVSIDTKVANSTLENEQEGTTTPGWLASRGQEYSWSCRLQNQGTAWQGSWVYRRKETSSISKSSAHPAVETCLSWFNLILDIRYQIICNGSNVIFRSLKTSVWKLRHVPRSSLYLNRFYVFNIDLLTARRPIKSASSSSSTLIQGSLSAWSRLSEMLLPASVCASAGEASSLDFLGFFCLFEAKNFEENLRGIEDRGWPTETVDCTLLHPWRHVESPKFRRIIYIQNNPIPEV